MSKVFAVTSGKGGSGKSTVAVGLATSFCRTGKKVLLVDMDEGLRCLDLMLGIDDSMVFDLSDALIGKEISDVAYDVPSVEGLKLIPAPRELGRIDIFSFTGFANAVASMFDIVIFDFPAGIDFTLYTALPENTLFIAVCNPDPVSIRDAAVVCDKLLPLGYESRLIVNNFKASLIRKGTYRNIDEIIDTAGLQLIGIVPNSDELAFLAVTHSLKSRGKAMNAFTRIAKRLNGEHILLPKSTKI